MPLRRSLPKQSGSPQAFRVRRRGLDAAPRTAGSRRQRRPIAIAAALNDHRGVRRGFLPRGLCNTCPDAAMERDRLRTRAGVAQALTAAATQQRWARPGAERLLLSKVIGSSRPSPVVRFAQRVAAKRPFGRSRRPRRPPWRPL
jgi:hypothetical protein